MTGGSDFFSQISLMEGALHISCGKGKEYMARKIGLYGFMAYFLYSLFFYWYLFYFADTSLPFEYQGTSADPATFLNGREFVLTEEYSKVSNLIIFSINSI